ncbi:DUF4105 domain-containing protein [Muriicola sp. Z0-33]|uniref:Lnb N-terminal periplasmic domain-containing protein n=1 Tax=Muriicola sp. Z0-33 TaxID=2816957 RepID=UPI0022374AA6|nr:DUF4105 domain-containing protein [Muriicola sp. Z0-33]MCW5515889.1 DUF4105 domain-containing protein [Muriicola sp. Z0-33]
MQLKNCILLFFLWISTVALGQPDKLNSNAQVSVITCGPGQDLYASFGHSAFRIQDPAQGIDRVYNYGTFNFNAPNFYYNFAIGRPIFSLSVSKFSDFLYSYQLENRWVKEQLLVLNDEEKNALFTFLERNKRPENRDYKYDYLYDNCSTKIPDVLKEVLGQQLIFEDGDLLTNSSFRDLIRENLQSNSWSSFGIDLALGAVIDRKIKRREEMFIPFKVRDQIATAQLSNKPLLKRERTILEATTKRGGFYFTTSPLFWFALLMVFTVAISYIDITNKVRSRLLDFFLFFITGITGLLIFFLWFLTDHSATAVNLNILWAFPLNLVGCFYLVKKCNQLPLWFDKFLLGLIILLVLALLLWIIGVQSFSPIISIIMTTLAIRYFFLYYHFRKLQRSSI